MILKLLVAETVAVAAMWVVVAEVEIDVEVVVMVVVDAAMLRHLQAEVMSWFVLYAPKQDDFFTGAFARFSMTFASPTLIWRSGAGDGLASRFVNGSGTAGVAQLS